jgi:hypothetical protein
MWFDRFIQGAHRRMGGVWIPDVALTITELLACLQIMDKERERATDLKDTEKCFEIASLGFAMCSRYSAGLRGEEIPKTDLGAMLKHWHENVEHPTNPNVMFVSDRTENDYNTNQWRPSPPLEYQTICGQKDC